MYVSWGWFAGFVVITLLAAVWLIFDRAWQISRITELDATIDENRDAATERMERLERRIRQQTSTDPEIDTAPVIEVMRVDEKKTDPATVPITVPDDGPPTLPDLKEAAKVAPPETTSLDAMYAEAMAAIDAIGKVER